ncbi:hypothetical protein EG347_06970 [Chryseobacterium sp. G0186]|nr:hypothetical protein EG347_06970 [Chryseobacterium sp. G0186]
MKRKENMEKTTENLFSNLTFLCLSQIKLITQIFLKFSRLKPASFDSYVAKKDLPNLRNLREIK